MLQKLAEPGHSPGGEFGVGDELLDVAEQAIDLALQRAFTPLHLDLNRLDPHPGHPVNRAGIGGQNDRPRLREGLVASLVVTGCDRQPGPDQALAHRRGILRFEHLEMPLGLRHIGRPRLELRERQDEMSVAVLSVDLEHLSGPVDRLRVVVLVHGGLQELHPGPSCALVELHRLDQVIDPLRLERLLTIGGRRPAPVAVQVGEFLMDRGAPGVVLERLFEIDHGIVKAASGSRGPGLLQDPLRRPGNERPGHGDHTDHRDHGKYT